MAEGDDEFQRVLHDSDRGFGGVLNEYGFEEGVDYILLKNEKSNSNNPMMDYIVTIDMAKEVV